MYEVVTGICYSCTALWYKSTVECMPVTLAALVRSKAAIMAIWIVSPVTSLNVHVDACETDVWVATSEDPDQARHYAASDAIYTVY